MTSKLLDSIVKYDDRAATFRRSRDDVLLSRDNEGTISGFRKQPGSTFTPEYQGSVRDVLHSLGVDIVCVSIARLVCHGDGGAGCE